MKIWYVLALLIVVVSGCVSSNVSENVVDDTVQRSEKNVEMIDCAYSNIEMDPNYSFFDESLSIFKTVVVNNGVSDIRLTGIIVWIDGVEQDEIMLDVTDDKYLIEKDKYEEIEFDLSDVLSGSNGELTKIKVLTDCPSVFDSIAIPSDGWKSE